MCQKGALSERQQLPEGPWIPGRGSVDMEGTQNTCHRVPKRFEWLVLGGRARPCPSGILLFHPDIQNKITRAGLASPAELFHQQPRLARRDRTPVSIDGCRGAFMPGNVADRSYLGGKWGIAAWRG